MKEALDLRNWSVEELAMLEQTLSSQKGGEHRFRETLGYISLAIMLKPVQGEVLDIHPECHTPIDAMHQIPEQRTTVSNVEVA